MTEKPEKNVSKSFRVAPELLKRFKIECAQRDTTQTEVVTQLIRQWLENFPEGRERREAADLIKQTNYIPTRWHSMLTDIFDRADPATVELIQHVLTVHHQHLPGEKRHARAKKA